MSPDRLSPLDASFLHIEDHVSHMHIASVAIFEGPPPPFADIVAMVDAKLDLVPRYRQKVRLVPLELGRPVWVDDPHFNIEYHLRHTALPAPGGESELRKLVGRVMAQQLDRSKPLWEIWVVEGLEDGRWAMLAKTHHALVDGVSGYRPLGGDHGPEPGCRAARSLRSGRRGPSRRASSSWWTRWRTSCGRPTSSCARRGRRPAPSAGWRATCSRSPVASSPSAGWSARRPLSSLNGPLGPHRRYAWATTSVDDIKRVRRALGGTFNDVVLASITNGFRELLLVTRRGRRAGRAHAGARLGPAAGRVGQGGRRRDVREQGLGDVRRAPGRHRGPRPPAPRHHRADEGPQGLQAGAGRRGTDLHVGLRAAHAAGPGHAPGDQGGPAQRQHRHHERARARSSRSTPPGGA